MTSELYFLTCGSMAFIGEISDMFECQLMGMFIVDVSIF